MGTTRGGGTTATTIAASRWWPPPRSATAWSTDEGDSWTAFDGVTGFWAVAFADEKTGWLVGVNGTITKIEF